MRFTGFWCGLIAALLTTEELMTKGSRSENAYSCEIKLNACFTDTNSTVRASANAVSS